MSSVTELSVTETITHLCPTLLCGVSVATMLTADACGNECPFRLAQRVNVSSDPKTPVDRPTPVPCCGGFLVQDVNLNSSAVQEVDLANGSVNAGHVDAFLTSADCVKLFDASYSGSPVQSLCKIYIGPVPAGTLTEHQKIAPGNYRLFAQAWASNESAQVFAMDLGIWTDSCRLAPTAPTP